MRTLHFFPEFKEDSVFQSVVGMNMYLSNVAYVDLKRTSKFGHDSKLPRRIFKYYTDNRRLLHAIASAIKSINGFKFSLLHDYRDSIMGQLLPSYHEFHEWNDKSVMNAEK